jgi:hypothetical protein
VEERLGLVIVEKNPMKSTKSSMKVSSHKQSWKWFIMVCVVAISLGSWLPSWQPENSTLQSKLQLFEAWVMQHGGKINNVELAEFPSMGVGLLSKSDINEKDAVLYLPYSAIM